jgi:hypothetical protein
MKKIIKTDCWTNKELGINIEMPAYFWIER